VRQLATLQAIAGFAGTLGDARATAAIRSVIQPLLAGTEAQGIQLGDGAAVPRAASTQKRATPLRGVKG